MKNGLLFVLLLTVFGCSSAPPPEPIAQNTAPLTQRGQLIHMSKSGFCLNAPSLTEGGAVSIASCGTASTWDLTNSGYSTVHKIYPQAAPSLCVHPDLAGAPVVLSSCSISASFTVSTSLNDGYCIGDAATSPAAGDALAWLACSNPQSNGQDAYIDWALEGFPVLFITEDTDPATSLHLYWSAVHNVAYLLEEGVPTGDLVPASNQVWELVTSGASTRITPLQDNLTRWVYADAAGNIRIGVGNPNPTNCAGHHGADWWIAHFESTYWGPPSALSFGGCKLPGPAKTPSTTNGLLSCVASDGNQIHDLEFTADPVYCSPTAGGC
jgi:hypothetical protein